MAKRLLIFDLNELPEGVTISKITRFFKYVSIRVGRPSKIGGRYVIFCLYPEEASQILDEHPSPINLDYVDGPVVYNIGSLPWISRRPNTQP